MQISQNASPRVTGQHFGQHDPVAEFIAEARSIGLVLDHAVDDDQIHRVPVAGKGHGNTSGSYKLSVEPDGFAYGWARNWVTDQGRDWCSRSPSAEHDAEWAERRAQARAKAERQREQEKAELLAESMREFNAAKPCQSHPYFTEKEVSVPADCRANDKGSALVPVYRNGKPVGFERILARKPDDGPRKRHCKGGLGDGFHWTDGDESTIYITEGIAKSMAVHEATGAKVYTAFGQERLLACAKLVREVYPDAQIIVAGDMDDDPTRGPQKAQEAATAVGGVCVLPPNPDEDWDDILRLRGGEALVEALRQVAQVEPNDDASGFSDDALAVELGLRGWDRDAKFVPQWFKWLFWDEARWVRDERLAHMTKIRRYLTDRAKEYEAWASNETDAKPERIASIVKQLRSAGKIAAVESMARSNPNSAAIHEEFDSDLMLLGTPGGTVDLRTGQLRPSRREDMLTKSTEVTPAPASESPRLWLEFLNEIFAGDQEVIAFMQRLAGYSLTGRTSEQRLFFLSGTGANGKSVFLNALTGLMGQYAQRASAETFLLSFGDKHSTSTAALEGARLVIGSELPKGRQWNDAIIKDLTGGDRMRARFMRQDEFEFTPQLTLMIAGNTKPSFGAVDEAMRRRVVMIPFDVTIPKGKRDPDLPEKLKAEWPAILRWAIEGAVEWQRMGIAIPTKIEAASAEYMDSEDEIGQFIADRALVEAGGWVKRNDLFAAYQGWCLAEGIKEMSSSNFYKAIEERQFRPHKKVGQRGFSGIRLH